MQNRPPPKHHQLHRELIDMTLTVSIYGARPCAVSTCTVSKNDSMSAHMVDEETEAPSTCETCQRLTKLSGTRTLGPKRITTTQRSPLPLPPSCTRGSQLQGVMSCTGH